MSVVVYFIRHAEPDYSIREDEVRPLSAKGRLDADTLVGRFAGIPIDRIYTSPFLRAMNTVRPTGMIGSNVSEP